MCKVFSLINSFLFLLYVHTLMSIIIAFTPFHLLYPKLRNKETVFKKKNHLPSSFQQLLLESYNKAKRLHKTVPLSQASFVCLTGGRRKSNKVVNSRFYPRSVPRSVVSGYCEDISILDNSLKGKFKQCFITQYDREYRFLRLQQHFNNLHYNSDMTFKTASI